MDLKTYRKVYNRLSYGDSIISNQNTIVSYKDSIIDIKDSIIVKQSFLLNSYKRELAYKDSTNKQLNNLFLDYRNSNDKTYKLLDKRFLIGAIFTGVIFMLVK